jgi:cytidyltransferase-like protein
MRVWVSGGFDDLRSRHVRLLEEASRLGEVRVALWSDRAVERAAGRKPGFPQEERRYILEALRYVTEVDLDECAGGPDSLPEGAGHSDAWAMFAEEASAAREAFCAARGISLRGFTNGDLAGFPGDGLPGAEGAPQRECGGATRKVVATGCFDWLHSGHVRFFEEVAGLGALTVVVGSDRNVRLLKGEGHPLLGEAERRYMVGSIRFVARALVSTGSGWMDAEPEIRELRPDMYAVNEDGDKPEKRDFCRANGIQLAVLRRTPKQGLARRSSTDLRGF